MAQAPKFSVVLIGKNEAKTLPRLMRSLREFLERGGEVVLCDTGSTDGTPEVARQLGCKVTEAGDRFVITIDAETAEALNREFVVEDEPPVVAPGDRFFCYSDARNFAASLASNDVVSMPDCDEEYTALDIDAVNRYIEEGYGQLEFLFVYAHDEMGRPAIQFLQCKMYDRRLLRWNPQCVIHEVLEPIDRNVAVRRVQLPENVLKIEHWQDLTKPRSHYLPGLCWEVWKHPDNDRNAHYLGRELLYTKRPKSAIQMLLRHIAMDRWPAEKAQSMIYVGDCHGMLNRPNDQVEWYMRAYHTDPTRREALMRLAGFYRWSNKPAAAAAFAAAALEVPWHAFYANRVEEYRELPHEIRYWGRGWIGNVSGAREDLLKCLEYKPFSPKYLNDTRYYFEYHEPGIEGWMRFEELLWLYRTAQTMGSVAEIGSWKGRSTHAICSGCKRGMVTAVDHFRGSPGEEQAHAEAKQEGDPIYRQFLANMRGFDNLLVIRADSVEAAEKVPDRSFDLVFIDASHRYEDVKRDIEAWLPKARIMIAGHDFAPEWPGVRRAVTERFGLVGRHHTIWWKYVAEPMVSIIIPTLGREEQLQRLIQRIEENAGWPLYEVLVMNDDWPPNRKGVPRLLKEGVQKARGELLMYLGTDCDPQPEFLREAVYAMLRHFPDYLGLVGLNDGIYSGGENATHWLAGRPLADLLGGELFHLGYNHVGCDDELTGRCRSMGRYVWCERARVNHHHCSIGAEMDETYRLGWDPEKVQQDRELLRRRSQIYGFPIYWNIKPRKIPRRAFSIWFGEDGSMPDLIQNCLRSQQENLREWEWRLITRENLQCQDEYVQKALEARDWVKASDYVRIWELLNRGGVYLDADQELYAEIPPELLWNRMFCTRESNGFYANSVIGAEAGHPTLGRILERMRTEYRGDDGVVFEAGMFIFTEEVDRAKFDPANEIMVLPTEVFMPFDHMTGKVTRTSRTIGFHHFYRSWVRT